MKTNSNVQVVVDIKNEFNSLFAFLVNEEYYNIRIWPGPTHQLFNCITDEKIIYLVRDLSSILQFSWLSLSA